MDILSKFGLCCFWLVSLLAITLAIRGWWHRLRKSLPAFNAFLTWAAIAPLWMVPVHMYGSNSLYSSSYRAAHAIETVIMVIVIGECLESAGRAVPIGFLCGAAIVFGGLEAWRLTGTLLVFLTVIGSFALSGRAQKIIMGIAIAIFFPTFLYLPKMPIAVRYVPVWAFLVAQVVWWPVTSNRRLKMTRVLIETDRSDEVQSPR